MNERSDKTAGMARKEGSHAATTGPAIRAAALKLFATSGYAAVSMRQIASEVGLRAGALYLYTPDKQTLLFDLMQDHMTHLLATWAETDAQGDPEHRLETFVRFHIDYHIKRRDEVFLAYMELRNLTPENFEVIEALRRDYEQQLEAILQDGAQAGDFQIEDVRLSSMAIIAMLTGVNTWYRAGGRLDRAAIQRRYWSLVQRMVAA